MVSKKVVLYVEGGGDSESLLSECRKGFNQFLQKAGFLGKMPRIKACGSRSDAYDRFKYACSKQDEYPILLVDSEDSISPENEEGDSNKWNPWNHVLNREGDKWEQPENSTNLQLHFMVECMEAWFLADVETLKKFYNQGFVSNEIEKIVDIEKKSKSEVFQIIKKATKNSKTKGEYGKGSHSFLILQQVNPDIVISKSKWANRFISELNKILV